MNQKIKVLGNPNNGNGYSVVANEYIYKELIDAVDTVCLYCVCKRREKACNKCPVRQTIDYYKEDK